MFDISQCDVVCGYSLFCMVLGDEVSGLSVSIRERDDLIQIWNTNSRLSDQSKIMQLVKKLLVGVQFYTVFYTG